MNLTMRESGRNKLLSILIRDPTIVLILIHIFSWEIVTKENFGGKVQGNMSLILHCSLWLSSIIKKHRYRPQVIHVYILLSPFRFVIQRVFPQDIQQFANTSNIRGGLDEPYHGSLETTSFLQVCNYISIHLLLPWLIHDTYVVNFYCTILNIPWNPAIE